MDLLTTVQVAEIAGVTPQAVQGWVLRGLVEPTIRGTRGPGKGHMWAFDLLQHLPPARRRRPGNGFLSSSEICAATNITYRQLDHWVHRGLIVPEHRSRGQGDYRWFNPGVVDEITELQRRIQECPFDH